MRGKRLGLAAGIGIVIAFGIPLGELWLDCRVPDSEACVWGRAYLPLSLGVAAVIALVITGISYLILSAIAAKPGDTPPIDSSHRTDLNED